MPKVPIYEQGQLASSLVGTPGVDKSGEMIMNSSLAASQHINSALKPVFNQGFVPAIASPNHTLAKVLDAGLDIVGNAVSSHIYNQQQAAKKLKAQAAADDEAKAKASQQLQAATSVSENAPYVEDFVNKYSANHANDLTTDSFLKGMTSAKAESMASIAAKIPESPSRQDALNKLNMLHDQHFTNALSSLSKDIGINQAKSSKAQFELGKIQDVEDAPNKNIPDIMNGLALKQQSWVINSKMDPAIAKLEMHEHVGNVLTSHFIGRAPNDPEYVLGEALGERPPSRSASLPLMPPEQIDLKVPLNQTQTIKSIPVGGPIPKGAVVPSAPGVVEPNHKGEASGTAGMVKPPPAVPLKSGKGYGSVPPPPPGTMANTYSLQDSPWLNTPKYRAENHPQTPQAPDYSRNQPPLKPNEVSHLLTDNQRNSIRSAALGAFHANEADLLNRDRSVAVYNEHQLAVDEADTLTNKTPDSIVRAKVDEYGRRLELEKQKPPSETGARTIKGLAGFIANGNKLLEDRSDARSTDYENSIKTAEGFQKKAIEAGLTAQEAKRQSMRGDATALANEKDKVVKLRDAAVEAYKKNPNAVTEANAKGLVSEVGHLDSYIDQAVRGEDQFLAGLSQADRNKAILKQVEVNNWRKDNAQILADLKNVSASLDPRNNAPQSKAGSPEQVKALAQMHSLYYTAVPYFKGKEQINYLAVKSAAINSAFGAEKKDWFGHTSPEYERLHDLVSGASPDTHAALGATTTAQKVEVDAAVNRAYEINANNWIKAHNQIDKATKQPLYRDIKSIPDDVAKAIRRSTESALKVGR